MFDVDFTIALSLSHHFSCFMGGHCRRHSRQTSWCLEREEDCARRQFIGRFAIILYKLIYIRMHFVVCRRWCRTSSDGLLIEEPYLWSRLPFYRSIVWRMPQTMLRRTSFFTTLSYTHAQKGAEFISKWLSNYFN